jgi:hypothetical protein
VMPAACAASRQASHSTFSVIGLLLVATPDFLLVHLVEREVLFHYEDKFRSPVPL